MWACEGDDEGEVCEGHYSSQNELPPFPLILGMDDGVQTGDDENEMRDSRNSYHHCVWSPHLPRAQEGPNSNCAGLHQVSDEEVQAVPNGCHRDSGSVSPRTVSAGKNEDGNVDDSLQKMKETKLRNHQRRYRQSDEEQHSRKRNPQAR